MNRLRKALIIIVSVVVVLVLSLVVFVRLYLTDERLRDIAEPLMEEQLGRDVSIGGFEVKLLKSLPNVSVGITELTIHSPSHNGSPAPDLANIDWLWVELPVLPVLQGNIQINALELDNPKILVEVYDDLSTNLIELGADEAEEAVQEPAAASSENAEIAIENIRIRDGQVGYVHADGTLFSLNGLNTDLNARLADITAIDGQVWVEDTYYEAGGVTYADHWNVLFDVRAETHLDSAWLRIDRAELTVQDLLLQLNGQVTDYTSDKIGVNLSLNTPDAPVSSFWSLLPSVVTKDISDLESEGVFSVVGSIKGDMAEGELPDLNVELNVADGMIKYPGLPSSIDGLSLKASLTNTQLVVESFTANADGASLSAQAEIADFAKPFVNADIDLNVDLERIQNYYPLEDSTQLAGVLTMDTQVSGVLEEVDNLNVAGTIGLESIDYQSTLVEQPINDLNGRIELQNDEIRFEELALTSGQSDIRFNGVMKNFESLLSDSQGQAPDPLLEGVITSSYLNLTEQISEDTSATFVGPLELPPLQLDLRLDVDQLEFNGMTLSDASGVLSMTEGIMGFKELSARLFGGVLNASGNFDLSDPFSPAFNGDVSLGQMPVKEFFSAFSDMDAIVQVGEYLQGLFETQATFGLRLDKDLNPQYESVLANGAFGARQGSFGTMPLQSVIAKFTGVNALESLNVNDWSHSFSVTGQRLHVQDLKFDAGEYAVSLNGSQSFDGTLDYRLSVELPESASNAISQAPVQGALSSLSSVVNTALKDPASGRIVLDLVASGNFADPSVRLDGDKVKGRLTSALTEGIKTEAEARVDSLQDAARERAEAELAEQRDRLEEKAEEGLENLVGGLVDSSLVSSPVDSLKEKGADALQDRLKGLLNRRKRKN